MGRYIIFIILFFIIGFVIYQIYGLTFDYQGLLRKAETMRKESETLLKENIEMQNRIKYLGEAENLIQEIKSRFNFRLPNERMIIVAPER